MAVADVMLLGSINMDPNQQESARMRELVIEMFCSGSNQLS